MRSAIMLKLVRKCHSLGRYYAPAPNGSRMRSTSQPSGFRSVALVSGFEENLNNAMNHFKLLWGALREQRINALADISWIFFSFQEQKRTWGQSKTSSHRDDRV